jgi:hypothetical protein
LKELAESATTTSGVKIDVGYVLEEDLEDFLEVFVVIKAFPTYIYFRNGQEIARVEGVDFDALQKMIDDNQPE